jgi:hypothetical protein
MPSAGLAAHPADGEGPDRRRLLRGVRAYPAEEITPGQPRRVSVGNFHQISRKFNRDWPTG